jgi:hypothetical protein
MKKLEIFAEAILWLIAIASGYGIMVMVFCF